MNFKFVQCQMIDLYVVFVVVILMGFLIKEICCTDIRNLLDEHSGAFGETRPSKKERMHTYVLVYMYVWMDIWMDGWMDGWMDVRMHTCMHLWENVYKYICIR